jgi:MFS family permease
MSFYRRVRGLAKEHWQILIVLIPFVVWNAGQLNRDLWYDEVVDLDEFALTDVTHTVSEYAGLHGNHHTLFNLVNNLYTRLIGVRELNQLTDRPWLLRILQFAIGFLSIGFTYAAGKRFFYKNTGFLAGLILVTSVPFLNFSLQLRGYSISMALVPVILYLVWGYEEGLAKRSLVLLVMVLALFLYTMPSNSYLVLSLGVVYAWRWVRKRKKPHLMILIAIGLSLGLFILAYSPLMDEFLKGKFGASSPASRSASLTVLLPAVFAHILSFRYLLLIPFLLGLMPFYRSGMKGGKTSKQVSVRLYELGILFLLPFFISFLRQDAPFQRTFVHLAPIWSLLFAAGIARLFKKMQWKPKYTRALTAVILFYCVGTLAYSNTHIQRRLYSDLSRGVREQDIFYTYYLSSYYRPSGVIESFASLYRDQPAPIIMADEADRMALDHYLAKNGLGYYTTIFINESFHQGVYVYSGKCQKLDSTMDKATFFSLDVGMKRKIPEESIMFTPLFIYLVNNNIIPADHIRFYVITMFPEKFRKMMSTYYPGFRLEQASRGMSYTNIFRVSEITAGSKIDQASES